MDISLQNSTLERQAAMLATDISVLSGNMSGNTLLLVLDAMPVPLAWFQLDDGKAVFVNRAFQGVFGYGVEEIVSWSHWSACFPDVDQRDRAVDLWLAQADKHKDGDAEIGLPVEQIELRVIASDTTVRTILHSGVVLPAMNCALAIYIDITKRKEDELRLAEAARAIREREVLYPILLDHTHEMIVVATSEGFGALSLPLCLH